MSATTLPVGGYKQLSASANVSTLPVSMLGIFVSAASATPTITVYDDTSTGTTRPIVSVFTPAAATWYSIPVSTGYGLYVVISGTVSCTVVMA